MTRSPAFVCRMLSRPAPLRLLASFALLALLAACATQRVPQVQEAANYRAHARGDYRPPGPPEDPWGPYIVEASRRYDVPDRWIREVMRVESGGVLYRDGELVTSWAGAMGLMQVMPETYDELRLRYSLGDDPYDPHDNILAGAAYLREMYELYGSPGFLAAYNAGPKRLDEYLAGSRALPDETRRYVARIAPYVADAHPVNRSPAEDMAMNQLPMEIPPGTRFGRPHRSAYAETRAPLARSYASAESSSRGYATYQLAAPNARAAPRASARGGALPQHAPAAPVYQFAAASPAAKKGGFRLISTAMADTLPASKGGGGQGAGWAIQVGAFADERQAKAALGSARAEAHGTFGHGKTVVASVQKGHTTLFRARVTGLSHDAAMHACGRVGHGHGNCIVLSPAAQS